LLKGQLPNTFLTSVPVVFTQNTRNDFYVLPSKIQHNDFKAIFERYSKDAKPASKKNEISKAPSSKSDIYGDFRSESLNTDKKTAQKSYVRQLSTSKKDPAAQLDECEEDKICTNNIDGNEMLLSMLAELSELLAQMGCCDKSNAQEQFHGISISAIQTNKDNSIAENILTKLEQLTALLKDDYHAEIYGSAYQDGETAGTFANQDSQNIESFLAAGNNNSISKEHISHIDPELKNQIINLMNSLNARITAATDASSENLDLRAEDINDIMQAINQKLAEHRSKIISSKQSNQSQEIADASIDENIDAAVSILNIEDNNLESASQKELLNANGAPGGNTIVSNSTSKVPGHSSVFANMLERINKDQVIGQVVKKIATANVSNKAEMVMELKPESLGKLTLKLVSENGLIAARFTAENEQVKQIIESNFQMLKDALEQKGYTIQGFSVSVGQDSAGRSNQREHLDISIPSSKGIVEEDIAAQNYAGKEQMLQSNYIGFTSSKIDFTA